MARKIFLFLLLLSSACFAQDNLLNQAVAARSFEEEKILRRSPKRILSLKGKTAVQRLNPFTYLSAAGLYVYQNMVSEQFQASCNYHISCSEFTKRSIEKDGFIRGLLLGLDQLGSCSSQVFGDYPDHMITEEGVIDNTRYLE